MIQKYYLPWFWDWDLRNFCPICYLPFPLCCAKHQIWQVFLQPIRRSTHASRLDLTVPSSPIKSEALREERVNRVWRAALSSQSVDVASRQPCSYFYFLFFFLQTCKNISADWCSLQFRAMVLILMLWPHRYLIDLPLSLFLCVAGYYLLLLISVEQAQLLLV